MLGLVEVSVFGITTNNIGIEGINMRHGIEVTKVGNVSIFGINGIVSGNKLVHVSALVVSMSRAYVLDSISDTTYTSINVNMPLISNSSTVLVSTMCLGLDLVYVIVYPSVPAHTSAPLPDHAHSISGATVTTGIDGQDHVNNLSTTFNI